MLYARGVKTGSAENEAQIEIALRQKAHKSRSRRLLDDGGVAARRSDEHEDQPEGERPESDAVGPGGEGRLQSGALARAADRGADQCRTGRLGRRLPRRRTGVGLEGQLPADLDGAARRGGAGA